MKNFILTILTAFSTVVCAQEYNTCTQYSDYGDFAKAKSCLETWKSKYATDPGYHYQLMYHAVKSNDAALATSLMEKINTLPATDFYTLSAKATYYAFSNDIPKAKSTYESVFTNHKTSSLQVMADVVHAFISYKTKDTAYAGMWIRMLEKEQKSPTAILEMLKGDFYASQGDHGTALNFYNLVLDMEPKKQRSTLQKSGCLPEDQKFFGSARRAGNCIENYPCIPLCHPGKSGSAVRTETT